MEIEPDPDEKKEYSCPSNHSHKVFGRTELQKHIMRCKDIQGKKFYQCKYDWTHMFHYPQERNSHEERCPEKREGVQRYKDYLFVPKDKEMLAAEPQKLQNKIDSASYYHRNKQTLQNEKEMRRQLREKREREEAEQLKKQQAIIKARQELEKYYTQDYVLQNAFYLTAELGSLFMVVAQSGTRKLEKKNLEMKASVDLGEKLMPISQLEYNKILAGEFVPHFDYEEKFQKLRKQIDSEGSIASKEYCEANDELVVITSHKYLPHIPENRLALLVLCNSRLEANERPFNIPENNTSNILVNEYNQLFSFDEEKDQLEKNFENENAIATFEYRESIKKKLRQVISLLEESKVTQTDINQKKIYENTLSELIEEERKLKLHEDDLTKKEKKMESELGEYKKKLTQDFLKRVNARQEQLNHDINQHYNTKYQVFYAGDQEVERFTEREAELRDQYAKITMQIEANSKMKKKNEQRVQIAQSQINEKKKMLSISKNIALTSVLDYLCHICQKNSIDILFYPCNHFFACQECQKKASEVGRHECLYCHQNVEKILHVLV